MADIEVVVKIPEEEYRWIMKSDKNSFADVASKECMLHAIKNGTPLSKGHGKIGDLDSIMNDISNSVNEMTNIGIMVDGEYLWAKLNDAIDNAQTIIPADTEGE